MAETKKNDSLKKRYSFKLLANISSFPITLINQSIFARGLGPIGYGDFNFLTNFFNQIIIFFDTGTSLCFYNKLSQRQDDKGLVKFYWLFSIVVVILLILFLFLIILINKEKYLWPDQKINFIVFALIWGILTWYSQTISKMIDAYGLTSGGEILRIIQRVFSLILVAGMFYTKLLDLSNFFYYQFFILLFLCFGWWYILTKNKIPLIPSINLKFDNIKVYIKEFYDYSSPLISYSAISMGVGIFDLWLLQKFAGSIQQGFYGISFKISAICFLFTGALAPLLMREFAIAFNFSDISKMRNLFNRYVPLLYTIAALISVFISIQSSQVSILFGGSEFNNAAMPIAVMALYPIHQTYGQLSGSVFFASGQTRLYRNIGIITLLLGVILTFFLLAPTRLLGLHLGSLGLAIKMVTIQFISVNIQLYFNAKFLAVSFWKYLIHQLIIIIILGVIAYFSKVILEFMLQYSLLSFFLSGILYVVISAAVIYFFPQLIAVSRFEQKKFLKIALNKIRLFVKNEKKY